MEMHNDNGRKVKEYNYVDGIANWRKLLKIMKYSVFGVELEGCYMINKHLDGGGQLSNVVNLDKAFFLSQLYNQILTKNESGIPVLKSVHYNYESMEYRETYDRRGTHSYPYPTITRYEYPSNDFLFSPTVGNQFIAKDTGIMWTLHTDITIDCSFDNESIDPDEELCAIEIVSPMLYMGDDKVNSHLINGLSSRKTKAWRDLEIPFKENKQYFEGLFILFTWFQTLFNNTYLIDNNKPSIRMLDTPMNGLHIHISNRYMLNNFKGRKALFYFIMVYAFFENVIGSFLHESRENNEYCTKLSHNEHHIEAIFKNSYQLEDFILGSTDITINHMYSLVTSREIENYSTINLIYINKDKQRDEVKPIHLEIRHHHSTNKIDAIYNWILFINSLLSQCIHEVNMLRKIKKREGSIQASQKFKELVDFMRDERLLNNARINIDVFNLLFDRFVCDPKLKLFYKDQCRNPEIFHNEETHIDPMNPCRQSFLPVSYFDSRGKMKKNNPLEKHFDYLVFEFPIMNVWDNS